MHPIKEFTKEELRNAADAAVAEFERETARAQSSGKNTHPHTVSRGKFYLKVFFGSVIPKNDMSQIHSWIDEYSQHHLSDQENNRAGM